MIVGRIISKKIPFAVKILVFLLLYAVGLLGSSYFELLRPLEGVTHVWNMLRLYDLVFDTTRNGLFFGTIFVGMGALFVYKKIRIKQSAAILGFSLSMIFLLIEVMTVDRFELALESDFYIFLVPAVFFLFYIVTHIEIKETATTIALRKYSSIIYFIHLWVNFAISIIKNILELLLDMDIVINSLLRYMMVAVGSLLVAIILVELQKHKPFRWLKNII
ncbi:MAG: hypothetical protein LUI87_17960 [Lachnospiraceae bacterium]|nr:hypothetical protein [Lachnospiraceae bacterium]